MKPITIKTLNYVKEHAHLMFAELIALRCCESVERIKYIGKKYGISLHFVRGSLVVKTIARRRYYFVKRQSKLTGLATYTYEYFSGTKLKKGENVKFVDGNPLNCRFDNLTTYSLTKVGEANRFKPGNVPFNKGTKGLTGRNRTSFKKGQQPHNTKHDGAVTVRTDSSGTAYKYTRIKSGKWVLYHRHLWEQANGPIPEGHILVFRDRDPMNCELDNLELITRSENLRRNYNRDKAAESMRQKWKRVRVLDAVGVESSTKLKTKRKQKPTPVVPAQVDAEQLKIAGGYFNRY